MKCLRQKDFNIVQSESERIKEAEQFKNIEEISIGFIESEDNEESLKE